MQLLRSGLGCALLAIASSVVLNSDTKVLSSSVPVAPKTLQVEGPGVTQGELGVWEVEVDTERKETKIRQISGNPQIKVASALGNGAITSIRNGELYENNPLITDIFGLKFATYSTRFNITNNTGSTLGQSSLTGTTGVELMLIPYPQGNTTTNQCPIEPTTPIQPICVISNTASGYPHPVGASGSPPDQFTTSRGFTNIKDPVFMVHMQDRTGASLALATNPDDPNPPETNEATNRVTRFISPSQGFCDVQIHPTLYSRSIWQPTLTIPTGATRSFGLRFRYAQDAPGSGQPRVTQFRFRFRILADRPGSPAPGASNVFTTRLVGTPYTCVGSSAGIGTRQTIYNPAGLVINRAGTTLYTTNMPDSFAPPTRPATVFSGITKVNIATHQGSNLISSSSLANLNPPLKDLRGLALSPDQTKLFASDVINQMIYQVDITTGAITKIAGTGIAGFQDGSAQTAQFNVPSALAIHPNGNLLFIADSANNRIRQLNLSTGVVTTLAGSGLASFSDGSAASAGFRNPRGLAVNTSGSLLYVADTGNNRIRLINLTNLTVQSVAGSGVSGNIDGVGSAADFSNLTGLAVSPNDSLLYASDNSLLRRISLPSAVVTTVLNYQAIDPTYSNPPSSPCPAGTAISPSGGIVYLGTCAPQAQGPFSQTVGGAIFRVHALEGETP